MPPPYGRVDCGRYRVPRPPQQPSPPGERTGDTRSPASASHLTAPEATEPAPNQELARGHPGVRPRRRHATRHRRVARQGAHDRGLPRVGLRRGDSIGHIRDLPHNAAEVPAKYKEEPWARLGVDVDNGFEPVYVVPAGQEEPHHQAEVAAQGRRRALPRDRRGPRGRGDRLAPVRRAEAEGAGAPDGVPRDHRRTRSGPRSTTRARSTRRSSTRRRPAASSTGCTATRSARCCGRRSCPACRPVGCSRSPPGWSSTASGSGSRSAPPTYWDLQATIDAGDGRRPAAVPRPAGHARRHAGRRRARLHLRAASWPPAATSSTSTPSGRVRWPRPARQDVHRRVGRVQALHAAGRTRRSAPRRCSRRPPASSASAPR